MEFLARAWQESDGEFSLYDGESGMFMSHYATEKEIIDRFKADAVLDGFAYRVEFKMNGDVDKTYIIVPAE